VPFRIKRRTAGSFGSFPRFSKLKISVGGKSVIVTVTDVCNSRYWGKRVDLVPRPAKDLGWNKRVGILKNVKIEQLKPDESKTVHGGER